MNNDFDNKVSSLNIERFYKRNSLLILSMIYFERIDVCESTDINKKKKLKNVLFVTSDIFR